jgi:S-adenosylmethionine:tRNA ribosyltransferase-isomerase
MIKLSEFDFNLPDRLIATKPASPRDHSRLLVLDKHSGEINHHTFYEVPNFLKKGDILVLNESKVFPARLIGEKLTGGKVEILLDKQIGDNLFEAIGKKLKIGETITYQESNLKSQILSQNGKIYNVQFNKSGDDLIKEIEKIGQTPLPPYILKAREAKRPSKVDDKNDYQTVYAKHQGSSAAPTAGLHFTDALLKELGKKGVEVLKVTLHVGLGTFSPIKEEDITKHKIHSEYYSVDKEVWNKIAGAKKAGRRVIAVGTTSARVIETLAQSQKSNLKNQNDNSKIKIEYTNNGVDNYNGWTEIYIYPGYKFECVDALITNFHLPKSSLLLLVSAFAGKDKIDKAYWEAINENYRFYSYGDAMLIN